ncbi:MAG: ThuA domain-containing protein, partial [Candidatus Hydrogenedentes bacterium]|nr:ThuA domain-containing protein [Candidatus Hydrogenedentota bacterium]
MKTLLMVCLIVCAGGVPTATAADRTGVLIIAGKDSHSWGAHEFHAGAKLLAKALNDSGLPVYAEVVTDQWPQDSSVFDGVKSVVIYCDGQDKHVLNGHADDMVALAARGVGLVCLHYALEVNPGDMQNRFLDWLGGYFDPAWSVNPVWTPNGMKVARHPVTRGVKPIEIEDEWYYHIR